MKRYKRFFKERRIASYKAWYNPSSNKLIQFNTNMIHSEIAEEQLMMNEVEAVKSGYYRIFVGHEVNIDSYTTPTEREFQATKYMIEENSYKKFSGTRWSIYNKNGRGFWFFPKLSFIFSDSLDDGILKKF